jgi:hypothetical protein
MRERRQPARVIWVGCPCSIGGNDKTMLRRTIRRLGIVGTSVVITVLSILISVIVRIVLAFIFDGSKILDTDLTMAVLIPLFVAPVMALIFVGVLKQVDEAEQQNARLVVELQEALAKAKTLSGLLPICASCKKIRDDAGYWHQVEVYIRDHAEVDFSHGLCPDCGSDLAAQIAEMKKKRLMEDRIA